MLFPDAIVDEAYYSALQDLTRKRHIARALLRLSHDGVQWRADAILDTGEELRSVALSDGVAALARMGFASGQEPVFEQGSPAAVQGERWQAFAGWLMGLSRLRYEIIELEGEPYCHAAIYE